MKGGRKEVRVAMARAHSRLEDSEQNAIDRVILMRSNNLSPRMRMTKECCDPRLLDMQAVIVNS